MANISFTRNIQLSEKDYDKILNSSPTEKLKQLLSSKIKKQLPIENKNKLISKYKHGNSYQPMALNMELLEF